MSKDIADDITTVQEAIKEGSAPICADCGREKTFAFANTGDGCPPHYYVCRHCTGNTGLPIEVYKALKALGHDRPLEFAHLPEIARLAQLVEDHKKLLSSRMPSLEPAANTRTVEIVQDVLRGIERADAKYLPYNSAHEGLGVLMEEFDELKETIYLQQHHPERAKRIYQEARDCAVSAARLMRDCTRKGQP